MNTIQTLLRFTDLDGKYDRQNLEVVAQVGEYAVAADPFQIVRIKEVVEGAVESAFHLELMKFFKEFETEKFETVLTFFDLQRFGYQNELYENCHTCGGCSWDPIRVKITQNNYVDFQKLMKILSIFQSVTISGNEGPEQPVAYRAGKYEGVLMPCRIKSVERTLDYFSEYLNAA